MNTGIYQITNLHNGKAYVGSAVSFRNRWKEHLRQLKNGKHHSTVMQRAWDKYGEASFEFKKLLVCAKADLLWFEQRAIDNLKPAYNICKVAGSVLGYRHTPEAKAAAAKRATGNTHRRGRKEPEEVCKRISAGRKGKGVGRVLSEETKAKIAAAHRGRTIPEDRRTRISAALTGRKQDPELVAKRAAGCYRDVVQEDGTVKKVHFAVGLKKSPEACLKMAKASATLNDEQVREIRQLLTIGLSCRAISFKIGVCRSSVLKIRDNTSYHWVD